MLETVSSNGITWKYEYDDNGNITEIYQDDSLYKEYTYDALGQLRYEVDMQASFTHAYDYDERGNITSCQCRWL